MIVHWSKHIKIEQLGKRVVSVECSHCGCEYYYTLIRIGTGSATAPYSIGVGRATKSAQKQANEELNRRLNSEAELVPCPQCFWINDELVEGYRQGRYRSLMGFAVFFAIIGSVIPLVYAWLYFADPALARTVLGYFFLGGTVLCWACAGGIISLRNWLRNRIQPNRHFPQPPRLPPGIPTAFVVDPSSGELAPAIAEVPEGEFSNGWLHFRIGHDHIPALCCDCLQPALAGQGHKANVTSTMHLEILRCADCARQARWTYWRTLLTAVAIVLLLTSGMAAWLRFQPSDLWILVVGADVILLALSFFLASRAIRPVKVRDQDRSRGIVQLRFRNPEYASVVAKHLSSL